MRSLAPFAKKHDKVFLSLFTVIFFVGVYVHQKKFDAPTAVSRLDLLHSIITQGAFSISAYHTNTPDKAVFNDDYYSDKAPGTAALAFPAFVITACISRIAGVPIDSKFGWLFSSWVACAGSIGIITALGGVALFAWLSKYVSPRWALITTLAVFLGAAPLPYATMMFSHALVVGLLAIAIWGIEKQKENSPLTLALSPSEGEREDASSVVRAPWSVVRSRAWAWVKRNRWSLFAGHACGWALASEYSSGLIVVGLFVWLLSMNATPSPRPSPPLRERVAAAGVQALPFCLAAIPPLLLIPAYSWACFGDPFTLPYSLQASFPAMKEGVYAIKWPDPDTAFNLLFTPARGLFFWTPFFVMAEFGYWQLIQKSRALFWLTYAVPLLQVVVMSGRTWDWPAGPAWGPRLLSPMIPLLALPCALGIQRFPKLGVPLAVYSILVTTLATLTDACPSYPEHPNPLFDLNIPLLLKGEFSPNLGLVLGLPPYASVALFYALLIGGFWWLWRQLPKESEGSVSAGVGPGSVPVKP